MKKTLLPIFIALVALSSPFGAKAATGIFGAYIGLDANGGGNTWYGIQEWGADLPDFQNLSLGIVSSLLISGGEVNTFKNSGGDVLNAELDWRVYSGAPGGTFATVNLPFRSDAPFTGVQGSSATGGGDQAWGSSALTQDVLAGLTPGDYTLEIFFRSDYSETSPPSTGTNFVNAGGQNYQATFTVVPEPATVLLIGPALLGGMFFIRRRRA